MLIDKPQCNFKNCRFYFDGNCRSADIYENCKLTNLHYEIAKLRANLDNAKTEGEWIEQVRVSKEGKPLLRHYKCNLCGVYLATQANFCPNCGAKMKAIKKEFNHGGFESQALN